MKRELFLILLLVVPVELLADGKGQEVQWQRWSSAVFAQAREEDRLVLLDLSAEWCSFCKQMDRTTWRDPAVLKAIETHYIPVRIQDEEQPELAEKFRRYGRPGTVVFDAEGEELVSKQGYLKPQWMQWMLEAVVQENRLAANP